MQDKYSTLTYSQVEKAVMDAFKPKDDERRITIVTNRVGLELFHEAMKKQLNKYMNTNLNFGQALEALKQGKAVQRPQWHAKGIKIYLNKGAFDPYDSELPDRLEKIEGIPIDLFEIWDGGITTRLPNISMVTWSKSVVHGYVPSQSDMLAEDWFIVSEENEL